MMQVAHTILMVRPAAFGFNAETAANNFFQNKTALTPEQLQQNALEEFDAMVEGLAQQWYRGVGNRRYSYAAKA